MVRKALFACAFPINSSLDITPTIKEEVSMEDGTSVDDSANDASMDTILSSVM